MSETKWTAKPDPGGHSDEWIVLTREGEDFRSVACCIADADEARLIAAAPELYEALKLLHDNNSAKLEETYLLGASERVLEARAIGRRKMAGGNG